MLRQFLFLVSLWAVLSQFPSRADEVFSVKYYEPLPSDNAAALLNKGDSCVKIHEDATALRDYQAVLKKGSSDEVVHAYIGMGNVYFGSKAYAQALRSFDKAVALVKKTVNLKGADPYRGRAKVYLGMSKEEDALSDMNVSMKFGKSDGRLQERASVLMKLKRYDKALDDYNDLIKMSPNDSVVYFQRAKVFEKLGDRAEAARDRAQGNALSRDLY
jgi:tetratricopeptide (TPR) repeat protein